MTKAMPFIANPRTGFAVEDPNRVWVSVDYSGQELMIAAAWSKDPAMIRAFKEPEEKTLPDGTKYKNPYADLHALTGIECCAPHLFIGVPEHELVALAKANGARKSGKITNFGIIFLQTAQSLSSLNHVPLKETEQWVKGHERTYAGYHAWAQSYGALAAVRGFAVTPVSHYIRWVDEENSKGAGESVIRAAVNAAINMGGLGW